VSDEDTKNVTAEEEMKKVIDEKLKEKELTKKNLSRVQKKNAASGQGKFGDETPAWHAAVSMTQ
jgi:hypothetical protein